MKVWSFLFHVRFNFKKKIFEISTMYSETACFDYGVLKCFIAIYFLKRILHTYESVLIRL